MQERRSKIAQNLWIQWREIQCGAKISDGCGVVAPIQLELRQLIIGIHRIRMQGNVAAPRLLCFFSEAHRGVGLGEPVVRAFVCRINGEGLLELRNGLRIAFLQKPNTPKRYGNPWQWRSLTCVQPCEDAA